MNYWQIINKYIAPLLLGLLVANALVGVFHYVVAGGDDEKKKTAWHQTTSGLLGALFVCLAWWLFNRFGDQLPFLKLSSS